MFDPLVVAPSRYRVEERGRRLVTIDTRTGQEYGADNGVSLSPISGPPTAQFPPTSMLPKQTSSLSALVVNAIGNDANLSATSASSTTNPGIAGKLVVLVVACLLLSVFLIMTNLWPVVVILLAIPQVRTVVVTQGKAKLRTLLDQAATG